MDVKGETVIQQERPQRIRCKPAEMAAQQMDGREPDVPERNPGAVSGVLRDGRIEVSEDFLQRRRGGAPPSFPLTTRSRSIATAEFARHWLRVAAGVGCRTRQVVDKSVGIALGMVRPSPGGPSRSQSAGPQCIDCNTSVDCNEKGRALS